MYDTAAEGKEEEEEKKRDEVRQSGVHGPLQGRDESAVYTLVGTRMQHFGSDHTDAFIATVTIQYHTCDSSRTTGKGVRQQTL